MIDKNDEGMNFMRHYKVVYNSDRSRARLEQMKVVELGYINVRKVEVSKRYIVVSMPYENLINVYRTSDLQIYQ